MDFRQIGRVIRANVFITLAVFLLIVAIGGAAAYVPAKTYVASILLLAVPANNSDAASAVSAIQYLLPQLALEAQDSAVLGQAAREIPAKFARVAVSVTGVANLQTGTLTLKGTSIDPAAAAAFVNADTHILLGLAKHNGIYTLLEPSPASVPVTPSNPRKEDLFGATSFALIAAVFAALGTDAVRRRLNKSEETRSAVGLAVLAEVPRVGRTSLRPSQVFGHGADPLVLEAFQELRSNLLLALPADRPATIAVTSGETGEGKSSVAAGLAWALASESHPVTVMDCDLRQPTMHLLLGTTIGPGVSGRGSLELDYLSSPTSHPYLNLIPAGIPDRHPVDIVSAYVPSLLGDLREGGRYVIVDCPPLCGVAETLLLASCVDVVVLVVDARHFDPAHVQQHQARLSEAGATVVGVVLNRVRIGAKRRKRSYYYGGTLPSVLAEEAAVPGDAAVAHA